MKESASDTPFNSKSSFSFFTPIKELKQNDPSPTSNPSEALNKFSYKKYLSFSMSEQEQYKAARSNFLVKASSKILEYEYGIGSTRQMLTNAARLFVGNNVLFFNNIDTKYKIKYQACLQIYNKTIVDNKSATTREELLTSLSALVHALNVPTGETCTTGFDLFNESLIEADLPPLGEFDKIYIKKIPSSNEESNQSFYPIIT